MNLAEELRGALRREAAPPGFTAKVVAKTIAKTGVRQRYPILALAAALTLAVLVPAGVSEYRQMEQTRGLEARRQLLVALTVTRTQLQQTKQKIQRATRNTL